jgi:hypothetical protein
MEKLQALIQGISVIYGKIQRAHVDLFSAGAHVAEFSASVATGNMLEFLHVVHRQDARHLPHVDDYFDDYG